MPPGSRWRHPLRAVATAAVALLPADQVTLVAILDGPDLWIDRRSAGVKDNARAPEPAAPGWARRPPQRSA